MSIERFQCLGCGARRYFANVTREEGAKRLRAEGWNDAAGPWACTTCAPMAVAASGQPVIDLKSKRRGDV